ncbi:BppU family phage baseplate upper protein [Jeotgalibaca sp. A127]|uniref:BppU family phage baseplate upper protein n=1 Tax=Jeotgalibaca sp. A127 TaxID=3457324 RepID=UPI003FD3BFDA
MLNNFRTTQLTWDKATKNIYEKLKANASDQNGRKLAVQIVNDGVVENLSGVTLSLYWETRDKSHDGLDAFTAIDASKGEFEIYYTTGMLSNVGKLNAALVLVDSVGRVVSDLFEITVTRGIDDAAIESENSFTALTQALIDASNLETNYAPRLNDLTAQLQQKATKGEIGLADFDKNKTQFDQTWISDSLREMIAGTAAINAVPADNSITTNKLANGAITTDKISPDKLSPSVLQGIKKTKSVNLFNKNTVIKGGFYQGSNGAWLVNGAWLSSDFIPVVAGSTYTTNLGSNITQWDTNKAFAGSLSGTTFTIPEGTAYIRVAAQVTNLDLIMVTLSSQYPSQYVPFDRYAFGADFEVLEGVKINGQNIGGVELITTQNLFDKSAVKTGGYYESDGSWRTFGGWCSSDFIPVVEGKVYKRSDTYATTFWDVNKNFIGGSYNTNIVPTPKGTAFVKAAVPLSVLDVFMLTLEKEYPDYYIPHKRYVFSTEWGTSDSIELSPKVKQVTEKTVQLETAYSAKYVEPIRLDLKDFSGYNQPYHPSVLYIAGGFNGYKYWMASSPLPTVAQPYPERYEVPVVHKSNDGINWEVVTSANPLDDLTAAEIANTDYMSDPHLVYRPDTSTLEVWYRLTRRATDEPTTVFRKTTTDGATWSARETMIPETVRSSGHIVQSPAILWDNVRKVYRLWYYNSKDGVYYNEMLDGGTYTPTNQEKVAFDSSLIYHHIDVNYFNGEYHFIGYHAGTPQNITHFTSTDGMNFAKKKELIVTGTGHPLYSGMLYRSVSILDENNKIRIYFSFNTNGNRGIGLLIANSFDDFHTVKSIDSNKVLLNSGMTLEDLATEVARLRSLIES